MSYEACVWGAVAACLISVTFGCSAGSDQFSMSSRRPDVSRDATDTSRTDLPRRDVTPDEPIDANDGGERHCVPGPGTTGAPTSITDAVELINSLPNPTTLECFVEALDRPLELNATSSMLSAQPAGGRRSPRVFMFEMPLVLSITLGETGRKLLEFGQLTEGTSSIKGELKFPIRGKIETSAPFDRIRVYDGDRTTCSSCHSNERAASILPGHGAFLSNVIRPPKERYVPVEELRSEHRSCVTADEPARCSLLDALFEPGAVRERSFP